MKKEYGSEGEGAEDEKEEESIWILNTGSWGLRLIVKIYTV